MKLSLYILSVALLIFPFQPECRAQEDDYGIGMVIPPGADDIYAVIYSKPDVAADTIATLLGWEYTIHGSSEKVRAFLVGFHKYDYWGLPLLSITRDSSWARVSRVCRRDSKDRRVGQSKNSQHLNSYLGRFFGDAIDAVERGQANPILL